ncbi:hypothetical protein ES703_94470 [subsurface metagenome]
MLGGTVACMIALVGPTLSECITPKKALVDTASQKAVTGARPRVRKDNPHPRRPTQIVTMRLLKPPQRLRMIPPAIIPNPQAEDIMPK